MTRRGKRITFGFLFVTALAVGWELVAAFDDAAPGWVPWDPADTWPWTHLLATLPAWLLFPLAGLLVTWLPAHLYLAWARRRGIRPRL